MADQSRKADTNADGVESGMPEKSVKQALRLAGKSAADGGPASGSVGDGKQNPPEPAVTAVDPAGASSGETALTYLSGVRIANTVLLVVVIVMISLAVVEVWASVREKQPGPPIGSAGRDAPPPTAYYSIQIPPIEDVLQSFVERPIFAPPNSGNTNVIGPVIVGAAGARAKKHLNVIGVSGTTEGREAIVVDQKTKRMFILKVGDEMQLDSFTFRLEQIADDQVVFSSGMEKVTIK